MMKKMEKGNLFIVMGIDMKEIDKMMKFQVKVLFCIVMVISIWEVGGIIKDKEKEHIIMLKEIRNNIFSYFIKFYKLKY